MRDGAGAGASSRLDFVLIVVARAALAAFLVAAVPYFAKNVMVKLRESAPLVGKDLDTARTRWSGEAYVRGVEALRETIPRDGAYLLVGSAEDTGADYWVRFDLAPRKAWYIGKLKGKKRLLEVEGRPVDAPPFVVVAPGKGRAPYLVDTGAFFEGIPDALRGQEDVGVPASIDVPARDAHVKGRAVIQGWCQERGGGPCPVIRIWIDGRPIDPTSVERFPRPDVEALVAGIGPCDRAGYRATFPFDPEDAGRHVLYVFFETGDGRYRRLGPHRFTWEP